MLYRIANKSGSRRELKISKISRIKLPGSATILAATLPKDYSDSSISSDSNLDEDSQPAGSREINILDHVVTDNIKKNKYQHNDAIDNDLTFDNNSFNLYSGTKDPLPVVTFSLRGGNKINQ